MKSVIQRVLRAQVTVDGQIIGKIGPGVLSLVAVEKGDNEATATRMLEKVLNQRIFEDESGKMNKSVLDIKGEHLMVSQFTLAADTSKGTRPSFTNAESPDRANEIFQYMTSQSQMKIKTETGSFRAHMLIESVNDGPVTLILEVK
jgi:D-tyrosyl-tRNA(Tyr) deacylase